jgi:hypothetical protein
MSTPEVHPFRKSSLDIGERVLRLILVIAMLFAMLLPIYGDGLQTWTALRMNLAWARFTIEEPMTGPYPLNGYIARLEALAFLLSLPILIPLNVLLAIWSPGWLRLSYFLLLTAFWFANLAQSPLLIVGLFSRFGSFGFGSIDDLVVVTVAWVTETVLLIRWGWRIARPRRLA